MTQYLNEQQPPTCLHILGQGLVNAIWEEGRDLYFELEALKQELHDLKQKAVRINIHVPEHSGGEPVDELIPLHKFQSFEVGVDDNSFTIKKIGDITTYGDLYGTDTIKLTIETRTGTPEQAQSASASGRTVPEHDDTIEGQPDSNS